MVRNAWLQNGMFKTDKAARGCLDAVHSDGNCTVRTGISASAEVRVLVEHMYAFALPLLCLLISIITVDLQLVLVAPLERSYGYQRGHWTCAGG